MNMSFPILIMTRNEGHYLRRCITSIIDKLDDSIDYTIYVIDNASNKDEQISLLDEIQSARVKVVRNKKNLWVLGLNDTLADVLNDDVDYFFLTDGDIDFSSVRGDVFQYLIDLMNNNKSLGKIGLSLDWSTIETDDRFNEILKQERSLYDEGKKIDNLFISPVDTTAAIYRKNWSFSGNSYFYPDHIRYLKPELYSCRTPRDVLVKHLGWDSYFSNQLSQKDIDQKVKCFTLVSGYIKNEVLSQASLPMKLFARLFWRPISCFWVFRRYYFLFKYILVKGRRKFENM